MMTGLHKSVCNTTKNKRQFENESRCWAESETPTRCPASLTPWSRPNTSRKTKNDILQSFLCVTWFVNRLYNHTTGWSAESTFTLPVRKQCSKANSLRLRLTPTTGVGVSDTKHLFRPSNTRPTLIFHAKTLPPPTLQPSVKATKTSQY